MAASSAAELGDGQLRPLLGLDRLGRLLAEPIPHLLAGGVDDFGEGLQGVRLDRLGRLVGQAVFDLADDLGFRGRQLLASVVQLLGGPIESFSIRFVNLPQRLGQTRPAGVQVGGLVELVQFFRRADQFVPLLAVEEAVLAIEEEAVLPDQSTLDPDLAIQLAEDPLHEGSPQVGPGEGPGVEVDRIDVTDEW